MFKGVHENLPMRKNNLVAQHSSPANQTKANDTHRHLEHQLTGSNKGQTKPNDTHRHLEHQLTGSNESQTMPQDLYMNEMTIQNNSFIRNVDIMKRIFNRDALIHFDQILL